MSAADTQLTCASHTPPLCYLSVLSLPATPLSAPSPPLPTAPTAHTVQISTETLTLPCFTLLRPTRPTLHCPSPPLPAPYLHLHSRSALPP